MISAVRLASSRVARANIPRAVTALGSTRSMSIGDAFTSKVSCLDSTSLGLHWSLRHRVAQMHAVVAFCPLQPSNYQCYIVWKIYSILQTY